MDNSRDYFINPGCFGDDLCGWLIRRLGSQGVATDSEPGQEDFGWYFDFETPQGPHSCVVSFRPDELAGGEWILWLEKAAGLVGSLLGRRRHVAPEAVAVVHRALIGAEEVRHLRWHDKRAFGEGREEEGAEEPDAAS